MNYDQLIALAVFTVVATGTPGPNNLMLLASGKNFGFRLTAPHIVGISCGMVMLTFGVGLGLGALFDAYPPFVFALKVAAITFLCYMSYKIAVSKPDLDNERSTEKTRPLRFVEAVLFQWINPKAWAIVISALATYASHPLTAAGIGLVASSFFLIGMPLITLWVIAGREMRRFLRKPLNQKIFNFTCAGLLLVSVLPILQ